jgi:hypothetical protein
MEPRRQAEPNLTPARPTGFIENSPTAHGTITYDNMRPAISHNQFVRTNTNEFEVLLAGLEADTKANGLVPAARTRSEGERTNTPGYLGTSSVVTNQTTRTDMNRIQPSNGHQTSPSNQLPSSLRQQVVNQAWIDIPSFLFKLSKPTRTTTYKPLDILTVREAWEIIQCLGSPGEFRSTINPSETECQDTIDHIRKMKEYITSEYTVCAKQYAVRYMNEHWEDNAQVRVVGCGKNTT